MKIFKKIGVCFVSAICVFNICSCDSNTKINSTVEKGTFLNFKNVDLAAYFNNNVLYVEKQNNKNETADLTYYNYSCKENDSKKIGTIANYSIESRDIVLLKNRFVYKSVGIIENGERINDFCFLDLEKPDIQSISKEKINPPLVYFDKLNDDEFIVHGARALDNTNKKFEYYIDKYNSKTNEMQSLVKTNYSKSEKTGVMLSDVCVKDNQIIAYAIEGSNNTRNYTIRIYDEKGQLLKTITVPQIAEFLSLKKYKFSDDLISTFRAFDKYYFFRTLNKRSLLLKYENGKFTEINRKSDFSGGYRLLENASKTTNIIKDRYVYFLNIKDNCIDIFDINTDKITSVEFKLDQKCTFIKQCVVNEEGNLILELTDNLTNTGEINNKDFLVKVEDIID